MLIYRNFLRKPSRAAYKVEGDHGHADAFHAMEFNSRYSSFSAFKSSTGNLPASFGSNLQEFLAGCLTVRFAFLVNIIQVTVGTLPGYAKKFGNLRLSHP